MKTVVLGVGNDLRADDAAGFVVGKNIESWLKKQKKIKDVLVICAQNPENHTKQMADFQPSRIYVIDSADFYAKPGEFTIVDEERISDFSTSSHGLPLPVILRSVKERALFNKPVVKYICIQPKEMRFGFPMTESVKSGVTEVTKLVKRLIVEQQ